MTPSIAAFVLAALGSYLAVGAAFAVAFQARGLARSRRPRQPRLPDRDHTRRDRALAGPAAPLAALVIARLRRRHRVATLALAVLMPPALAIALASRSAAPIQALPPALADAAPSGAPRWSRDDLWSALPVRTRGFAGDAGALVELAPLRDPMLPDLLVYWAAGGGSDRLPDGARLLGRLAGTDVRRFAVPAAGGRLYLYSLGHARLVDSAALPDAG